MKVFFVSEGPNGCGLYRAEIPIRYLPTHGIEARLGHIGSTDAEILWGDVIVVQKQYELSFLRRVESFKKRGKKVIYELDDDVFSLPSWNPAHAFYMRIRQNVIRYLKAADAVICSTPFLAQQMRKHNPTVYVCPNSLDFGELDRMGTAPQMISALDRNCNKISTDEFFTRCEGRTVIGWLGSPTHKKDLQLIVPCLKRITRQYGNKVMIVMGGAAHKETVEATSHDQIMFLEMVPPRTYLRYLASLPIDIGLAPVADHLFNYSKSNLKVIEYMACGFVPVASNLITYNATIRDGDNGFLCRNPAEWIQTVRKLVDNPELRGNVKQNGARYVRARFDIAQVVGTWAGVFKTVHGG